MLRKQIVAKAREYLNTPFQHQGRVKGLACDCVGLPYMVADELGICDRSGNPIHRLDNTNYSSQPMGRFVHEECQRLLIEKSLDDLQEGDLVTVKVPTVPCHVAVITKMYEGTRDECLGMIHAYAPAHKVVEHVIDERFRSHFEGAFMFPGVE